MLTSFMDGPPKQHGRLHGESFSKSPDFNSWGAAVALRAEVPLAAAEDTSCALWSDIEGTISWL